jgi:hypothetical protein
MSFEARCQQLDSFCHRLEGLAGQLSQSVEALSRARVTVSTNSVEDELLQAANALQSLPVAGESVQFSVNPPPQETMQEQGCSRDIPAEQDLAESDSDDSGDFQEEFSWTNHSSTGQGRFGSLVTDSYGKLRSVPSSPCYEFHTQSKTIGLWEGRQIVFWLKRSRVSPPASPIRQSRPESSA